MPVLPKDLVRARRTEKAARARELGINLDNERQRYGTNPRALAAATAKLINEGTPASYNDTFVTDAPPAGVFDSSNKTFTLSAPVSGLNISVVFTDLTAGTGLPLRRSDVNPPPADGFYFDVNNPTQIIVGTAPAAGDMLAVVFKKP